MTTTPTQRTRAFLDGLAETSDQITVATYTDYDTGTVRRLTLGDLRAVVEHAEIVAKIDDLIEEMRGDLLDATLPEQPVPARLSEPEPPHSRACGFPAHPHGPMCHPNCPTCGRYR